MSEQVSEPRKSPTSLSQDQKVELVRLRDEGVSDKKLGELFGIHSRTVRYIAREIAEATGQSPRSMADTHAEVIRRKIAGQKNSEIAKELGYASKTIDIWISGYRKKGLLPGFKPKKSAPVSAPIVDHDEEDDKPFRIRREKIKKESDGILPYSFLSTVQKHQTCNTIEFLRSNGYSRAEAEAHIKQHGLIFDPETIRPKSDRK